MIKRLILLIVVLLALSTYGSSAKDSGTDGGAHKEAAKRTDITLFVSYIPSVQFAPVYAAIENGYFEEAGIHVEVEYSFNEADGVDRLALNDLQFGIISGEQVIVGRGVEKPLVYVMEWFHGFPVGIVAPANSDIEKPEDLAGHKVGIPGPYGASYMGFRAILNATGLTEEDMQVESIGFTAPESMCEGMVEASVVYITNEPVTIAKNCFDVIVFPVSDYASLVANGLVTNEKTIQEKPELVRGMVQALLKGVAYVIDNPDEAFELSLPYVLDLPEEEYDTQRQVLNNSIELWKSDNPGWSDPERWQNTHDVMLDIGFLREPLDEANLAAAYDNTFLPE